ncbi:SDR family NAD(P)-dependent oxidoreductase [Microbacterium sp. LWH7-1.2]|uniref:SDR family NAD(P)-dependent oxidoreductase n=1 Tax=Microbacterium sp. LWH7-1.2 TaxID=3135257 RepID=UPI0031393FF8
MSGLGGKVVLVTGGGGGIGAAIAERLATDGARVIVHDLGVSLDGQSTGDPGPAQSVADGIVRAGGEAVAEFGDVTDYDAMGAVFERAIDRWGSVDVVVPVAGILRDRMIFNMTPEEWDAVIKVHLRGLYTVTSHASRHWRAQEATVGGRRLIAVTSRSGLFGAATQPNYSAAKLGGVGFVYSCAKALSKYDVASMAIAPTAATRMTATQPGDRATARADDEEFSPDNVARVVSYLAGDRSSWLNGQVVGSNGYQIDLYTRPRVGASVRRDAPWDADDLATTLEAEFQALADSQSALGMAARSDG